MDAPDPGLLSRGAVGLQGLKVKTTQGRHVGRVFDLRTCWTPGDSRPLVVQALLVGRAGWMERVGLRPRRLHPVPWSAVQSCGDGVIVVDDHAFDQAHD
jgi:sporulation protein YlmC with PRC-barrel domain